jgi:hypothetical protein
MPVIPDDGFKPVKGQVGKDVMWLPTPQDMVDKLLTVAEVTPKDIVYDLGAGDGVIAITAAKSFGARSVGIEYDQKMADFALVLMLQQPKALLLHARLSPKSSTTNPAPPLFIRRLS